MIRLKQLRENKGLTQAELAKLVDISASSIGMYEQGRREPSQEVLLQFADFFNVSVDYILGRDKSSTKASHSLKDQRDLNEFLNNTEIMFDGELHQLDDEDREKLRHALEFVFWQAKEKNKRKPTK